MSPHVVKNSTLLQTYVFYICIFNFVVRKPKISVGNVISHGFFDCRWPKPSVNYYRQNGELTGINAQTVKRAGTMLRVRVFQNKREQCCRAPFSYWLFTLPAFFCVSALLFHAGFCSMAGSMALGSSLTQEFFLSWDMGDNWVVGYEPRAHFWTNERGRGLGAKAGYFHHCFKFGFRKERVHPLPIIILIWRGQQGQENKPNSWLLWVTCPWSYTICKWGNWDGIRTHFCLCLCPNASAISLSASADLVNAYQYISCFRTQGRGNRIFHNWFLLPKVILLPTSVTVMLQPQYFCNNCCLLFHVI